eukprot:TRINITY_DN66908_c0_g1_i1.p1 TRINITY_DN66908_c0_g1~~TRINITY_DN66908_c0_g1_i1.p1  ORF type:complete len:280 (+),score=44.46 TRINITY_DN66908_c0_g1_i1:31-870(+)
MPSHGAWLLFPLTVGVLLIRALSWLQASDANSSDVFVTAHMGSHVRVRYHMRNDEGSEAIDEKGEMEFVVGESEESAHLDGLVQGMAVGETREAVLGEAFGARREDWVVSYDIDDLPPDLEVGMIVDIRGRSARVIAISDSALTLDFNHPLAGLNLTLIAVLLSCEDPREASVAVETMSSGDGTRFPKNGDTVRIHCEGSYAESGETFYSSREKGEPYEFQLGANQVIEGLEIGIQNVSLGGRARIRIPASLAYGKQSASVQVAVDKDVVYEVELLSVA